MKSPIISTSSPMQAAMRFLTGLHTLGTLLLEVDVGEGLYKDATLMVTGLLLITIQRAITHMSLITNLGSHKLRGIQVLIKSTVHLFPNVMTSIKLDLWG